MNSFIASVELKTPEAAEKLAKRRKTVQKTIRRSRICILCVKATLWHTAHFEAFFHSHLSLTEKINSSSKWFLRTNLPKEMVKNYNYNLVVIYCVFSFAFLHTSTGLISGVNFNA
jgi:ammonia channel protein AmtB